MIPTVLTQSTPPLSLQALTVTLASPVQRDKAAPHCLRLPPASFLLLAARLAELYSLAFPDRPDWLAQPILWEEEAEAIEAVEQFLERVHDLFPVHHEFSELDLEDIDWWLHEIPITPFGFDLWDESCREYKEPIPFLYSLMVARSGEAIWEDDETYETLYPAFPLPPYLEPERLVGTLRQMALPAPLTALPDLIQMLAQTTGNLWLDSSVESLAENVQTYHWTTANIGRLQAAWQEAEPVLHGIFQLLDWHHTISGSARPKLSAIHDLLLQAYNQFQSEKLVKDDT